MQLEADYVIVGAGSAGCILANRLSADGASVLLLEAGPSDWHPMIHVPAGMMKLLNNPAVNWNFMTEPDPGMNGRRMHWPRGKVLGGCSSINGMAYVRGNPEDFDGWAAMGCTGWSFDEVLPYFKKSERYERGDPAYRGKDGPVRVLDYTPVLPVTHRFVKAAQEAGHVFTDDINGPRHEGVGYSQMTRNGRFRGSMATTFLRQARGRPNLRVETGAHAQKLLIEASACRGVQFLQKGVSHTALARREVIVASGAIGSPQLLQLSGIGDPAHLREIGVPLVHACEDVGRNLSDHYRFNVSYRIKGERSINELARGWRLAREVARWTLTGRGALTYGVTSSSLFCRSSPEVPFPDLQILFTPTSFDMDRFGQLERKPGVTAVVCAVRPRSRGTVLARSTDALAPPAIQPNYLSDPADMDVMLAGVQIARDVMSTPAMQEVVVQETVPGAQVADRSVLEPAIRNGGGSVYHPVGTCRMGSDAGAVVDARLRVRGVANLRVIDASVMPCLTAGNTAAPTMMIAEKGAAMVLEDALATARHPRVAISPQPQSVAT